jgi:AcrR family transcriptional regulator
MDETRMVRAERILDTTAELLLRHGYKRVTIDDVATGAGVGKGTVYLHWKTREALFWAVLQRDTMRLLEEVLAELAQDPGLARPGRLMRAIFLQATRRPLVLALLLADAEVLGSLAKDPAVVAAQQELAGRDNYLEMLSELGLLRPGLTPRTAGYVLGSVMRGFFGGASEGGAAPQEQADLLADVLRRALENDETPSAAAVSALAGRVRELFAGIVAVQRGQLERAYS